MQWGLDEWRVTDRFGQAWRFRIVRPGDRDPEWKVISRWDLREDPIDHLIYFSFNESRLVKRETEVARDLIEIYDALTGSNLAGRLSQAARDPRRRFGGIADELTRVLYGAVEVGALKFERHVVPWPFPEEEEKPEQRDHQQGKDQATWFECTVVDDLGTAVEGLDVTFAYDGQEKKLTTPGSGKLRIDPVTATFATVALTNLESACKMLKPRWDNVRGPSPMKEGDDVVIWKLREGMPKVELSNEQPRTISIRPYVECARLLGGFFEKNKCFVLPVAVDALRGVVQAYNDRPGTKLLLVAHTDKTGRPSYNDALSCERAKAVAAYFEEDVEAWYAWYGDDVAPEKQWGTNEDIDMIGALPDASQRDATEDRVSWFQRTRSLEVDGICGSETRHKLIAEYMTLQGTSLPQGTIIETHGCGENFPRDEGEGEGEEEPDNRRVEIFFFDAGLGIQPKPPGENSAKGSKEYAEWVTRAGKPIDFSADDEVLLALEWVDDMVDALPKDLTLVLSGEDIEEQEHDFSGAERADGLVRLSFGALNRGDVITLTAKTGGRALVLVRDQVASDVGNALAWEHQLEELVAETPPEEV